MEQRFGQTETLPENITLTFIGVRCVTMSQQLELISANNNGVLTTADVLETVFPKTFLQILSQKINTNESIMGYISHRMHGGMMRI